MSAATVLVTGLGGAIGCDLRRAQNQVASTRPRDTCGGSTLTSGTKVAVLSNLENAVGVFLSSDLQNAYISEQAAGGSAAST